MTFAGENRRWAVAVAALWLLVPTGCDGSLPASRADAARPPGGRDGSSGLTASAADGAVRAPSLHRAAAAICPAARGPGQLCTGDIDASAGLCQGDGDCTAGTNGRCFPASNGPVPACSPTACSYDACASDDDCPARVPCLCRASATASNANVCAAGGNCAVDADCGPGGSCSPGGFSDFCFTPVYFCHTTKDTCVDNSDCPRSGTGYPQSCNYDPANGHFACGDACVAPP